MPFRWRAFVVSESSPPGTFGKIPRTTHTRGAGHGSQWCHTGTAGRYRSRCFDGGRCSCCASNVSRVAEMSVNWPQTGLGARCRVSDVVLHFWYALGCTDVVCTCCMHTPYTGASCECCTLCTLRLYTDALHRCCTLYTVHCTLYTDPVHCTLMLCTDAVH